MAQPAEARTCPVTGFRVHRAAEDLVKANAVAAVVALLLGGLAGAGSGTLGGPEAGGLTLSMLLYDTAFNYGQFGYAGAIALLLFATILLVTAGLRQTIFRDSEG